MFNFLISSAHAEAATDAANATGATPNPLMNFVPFIFIFIIFYFLMIRPQKKKLEQEQSMINALGKGDEIYTKSGILGTIIGLSEKVATIEIADGVKIKIMRGQIGGQAKDVLETKKEEKK